MTTRAIVPRGNGEGSLGKAGNAWGAGFFTSLVVGGKNVGMKKVVTASGNFTVPDGKTEITISACAGGGGGSGFVGCGGGGGQSIFRKTFTVTPGQVIPITIGAGGQGCSTSTAPTTTTYALNGVDGGDTIIGSLITLKGGKGAICYQNEAGLHYNGGARGGFGATDGQCLITSFQNIPENATFFSGGNGGNSLFGTGGTGGTTFEKDTNYNANDGIGYGAGGGGCGWSQIKRRSPQDVITTAGSGTDGVVIIEWE